MAHPAPKSNRSRIPHPILKRDTSPFRSPVLPFSRSGGGPCFSPHVHFPPTPGMSSIFPAHSPTTYDRKPIVTSPNVVQLPRRGERRLHIPSPDSEEPGERRGRQRSRSRGRERGPRARSEEGPVNKGSYFHPRAYEACVPEPADDPAPPPMGFDLPPLVHDLSPSDESDELVMTPPQAGAGLAGFVPVARSMPLQLPEAAKGRLRAAAKPDGGDSLPVVPPRPASYHAKGRHRSGSARIERRGRERGTFSPDLDEGCLGGF